MVDQPTWRRGFNELERAAVPRIEQILASEEFRDVLALVTRAKREARLAGESFSRGLLHRLNLPTNSDVTRLLGEIGRLQVDVRRLNLEIRRSQENGADDDGRRSHAD